MMSLTKHELAKYMDHTLLKADATKKEIQAIIDEAKEYDFASICVNPYWVAYGAEKLKDTTVNVCTVIGFPLGANTTAVKVAETIDAIENGATEVDMVINIGELKGGNDAMVTDEIAQLAKAAHDRGAILKVIIETALLTEKEIIRASEATVKGGADFVKTSTGFSTAGAKLKDVKLMRETVGPNFGVKASGGIHSRQEADDMILAGATRLGVSASVAIMNDEISKSNY
ncbi:deoxyribose-phosphate aldolase [Weissella koreensis]|uniref:Deoxyribose-phosphate aldolase n=2 Tax=Weissella koreensis TaxID=165096 RepID=A0A7H1MM59_9LACO|nr:deoxyribose-phosphate aldolase [Weissella koreensis KACC 15510]AVH75341.1 deoxyribose-phosphate aldolase [Weissella koreensis]QGN20566.1 deoxyribose-phosphate aldolase [Weissella koreensis]QNT64545.1 deoxyribose-phosphate aldolase [Weissella koreensis]